MWLVPARISVRFLPTDVQRVTVSRLHGLAWTLQNSRQKDRGLADISKPQGGHGELGRWSQAGMG